MSDLDLLAESDVTVWAERCTDVIASMNYTPDWEDELQELLVVWFANAMCAAVDQLTIPDLIRKATQAVETRQILYDIAAREFTIAVHKLEEADMWFDKGMKIHRGWDTNE